MKTKKANYLAAIAGAILLGVGLALALMIEDPQGMMRALPFLCIGIGCGMLGCGISMLLSQGIMKKYPEIEKQKRIVEQDERNILLSTKAAAQAYKMASCVFWVLMVAFTLMGVELLPILLLVGGYLLVAGYAIYCRVKLEKEL